MYFFLHQQLCVEQMGITMFRTVQHVICNIIILRVYQDRIPARSQKCLDGVPPFFICESNHVFTGKLRFRPDVSLFKFTVDLITQPHILWNLSKRIAMFFTVLYDPVLHVQTPVQFCQLPLGVCRSHHQPVVTLVYFLFEPGYCRRLFRSRVPAPAEGRQHVLILHPFFLFKKLIHQFADHRLKMLQLSA